MAHMVQLKAQDGHILSAWLVGNPEGLPLVVVQEAFGVNHHIRSICQRFADEGFRVIAPALFDRIERDVDRDYSAESIAKYRVLRPRLDEAAVLLDLGAAAEHVGGAKTGVVGYCFGGSVAWWAATRSERFAAASCWYGSEIVRSLDTPPICPVQMHFAELDSHISMEDVDAIRDAQPLVEIHVYPGVDHGFGCDERSSFHEPSYRQAQRRTIDFLTRHVS